MQNKNCLNIYRPMFEYILKSSLSHISLRPFTVIAFTFTFILFHSANLHYTKRLHSAIFASHNKTLKCNFVFAVSGSFFLRVKFSCINHGLFQIKTALSVQAFCKTSLRSFCRMAADYIRCSASLRFAEQRI